MVKDFPVQLDSILLQTSLGRMTGKPILKHNYYNTLISDFYIGLVHQVKIWLGYYLTC